MPPQSRGDFQSKSTPNLPTLRSFEPSASTASSAATTTASSTTARGTPSVTHPNPASQEKANSTSKKASIGGFSLVSVNNPSSRSLASSDDGEVGEDDDEVEDEDDGPVPNLPPRPLYYHHSRSHTHLGPSAFAPPFYNRPPTPLPPSPSLTSLLRPTFSSANSRPTTPDPSSDEGGTPHTRDATGTQTPNSAVASTLTSTYRSAKPIPRASPKVPTYEYYGFTLYLTSSLAFIVYLFWSFLPEPFLHQLGIFYYPDRWWALAIPAWTVMFILYIYVALASYNTGYLTLPLDSVECLVDEAANVAVVDGSGNIIYKARPSWQSAKDDGGKPGGKGKGKGGKGKYGGLSRKSSAASLKTADHRELDWRMVWNEGTDAVMDIPVGGVCEILYGPVDERVGRNEHEGGRRVRGLAKDR